MSEETLALGHKRERLWRQGRSKAGTMQFRDRDKTVRRQTQANYKAYIRQRCDRDERCDRGERGERGE